MFDGEVDEDIDLVENVLINYVEKTATLKGEDGEIKLGNVYDEEGNVETSYSIAIDEAPPSGFYQKTRPFILNTRNGFLKQ